MSFIAWLNDFKADAVSDDGDVNNMHLRLSTRTIRTTTTEIAVKKLQRSFHLGCSTQSFDQVVERIFLAML